MSFVERIVEGVKERRARRLRRCYRACFLDEQGNVTEEAERVLADLREHAQLFSSGVKRDGQGCIDKDALLRIEGRRELVLRIISSLEVDPLAVGKMVEVDNA